MTNRAMEEIAYLMTRAHSVNLDLRDYPDNEFLVGLRRGLETGLIAMANAFDLDKHKVFGYVDGVSTEYLEFKTVEQFMKRFGKGNV